MENSSEVYYGVELTVIQENGTFDVYFSNPPGYWHIPQPHGVPAIRGHENAEAAMEAGKAYVNAHQPILHEEHGIYILYAKLWFGVEKWGYSYWAGGSGGNSKAEYDSPAAAIAAGRIKVKKELEDLEAEMDRNRQLLAAIEASQPDTD